MTRMDITCESINDNTHTQISLLEKYITHLFIIVAIDAVERYKTHEEIDNFYC